MPAPTGRRLGSGFPAGRAKMRTISARTYALVAVTCLAAAPFVALGLRDALGGEPPSTVALYLWALTVLLSFRPIRIASNVELSASELAVLAGMMLVPPGELALLTAFARLVVDIATRKSPVRILRNTAAQAISAGTAAIVFRVTVASSADRIVGNVGELILAGALGTFALVLLDVAQILTLQLVLGVERLDRRARAWIGRTARAQLLWGFTAVITIQIVLIEPWFLLPGIPIFLLGYLDIRARFGAERRAKLLETLVSIGHAVGSSLDPTDVFRSVYRQVTTVMDADNFYVATLDGDGTTLRYRFLVDNGKELAPVDRPKAGTLAGAVIDRGEPLLLRDLDRDRVRLAIPELTSFGAVKELAALLAESMVDLLHPTMAAVYLEKGGGETLEFAASTGKPSSDTLALPKSMPLIARVLESGQPVTIANRDEGPEGARSLLERFGQQALLVHPLRSADQNIGVLLVTWGEPHPLTDEERE